MITSPTSWPIWHKTISTQAHQFLPWFLEGLLKAVVGFFGLYLVRGPPSYHFISFSWRNSSFSIILRDIARLSKPNCTFGDVCAAVPHVVWGQLHKRRLLHLTVFYFLYKTLWYCSNMLHLQSQFSIYCNFHVIFCMPPFPKMTRVVSL